MLKYYITGLLVFVVSISNVCGHMCMLSPPQRGSMSGLNKAAANDCGLVTAECGGREPPSGKIFPPALAGGHNFTVSFQKNLDHYTSATPGYFSVSIADATVKPLAFKELVRIPDKGEPSLSLYGVNVTMPLPESAAGLWVLQTKYVTNNKDAPPAFYQCSDILVYKPPSRSMKHVDNSIHNNGVL